MPLPFPFDFKNPDYIMVLEWRAERIQRIRSEIAENPESLAILKSYYADNPAQFIIDWGMTYDPRNIVRGLPASVPFLLFPKQEEWVHWFIDLWKSSKPGLTVKSRDVGASELACALAATHAMFLPEIKIGFGSRKAEYVDSKANSKALLYKVRKFVLHCPVEFNDYWSERQNSTKLQVSFPSTRSVITGEIGDSIGRGDRTAYYHVDESAWLVRPDLAESGLAGTTTCRHDLSTPHGPNNPFARKVQAGKISVFYFHWTDDPRKSPEWYKEQCDNIDDPVIIAQELDLDFTASMEGVIIPAEWVMACIDAHIKLGVKIQGVRHASLDVADEGRDKNALIGGQGILIEYCEEWSGKNSDIYATTKKAVDICDALGYEYITYDADGLGAGVRGDAREINEKRAIRELPPMEFLAFRGSGEVVDPDKEVFPSSKSAKSGQSRSLARLNKDYFGNAKAQAWISLAKRVRNTYRAVVEKQEFNPNDIISISSAMPQHLKLVRELSQPTRYVSDNGKLYVNKQPDGMPSPNYGDACMMYFAKLKQRPRGFFDV